MFLTINFTVLFLNILFLFFIPNNSKNFIRNISLIGPLISLIFSSILLGFFNTNHYLFQNLAFLKFGSNFLNIYFSFGLDGISLLFFFLSNFLIILCLLFIFDENSLKEYSIVLLVIDLFLLLIFSSLDLLLFYIFFEAILIPMFIMIGLWGSRERKIRAVYLFFFYTLFSSLMMLLGLLYIYNITGTLNLELLLTYNFTFEEQFWLWLAFFFVFCF